MLAQIGSTANAGTNEPRRVSFRALYSSTRVLLLGESRARERRDART